MSNTLQRLRWTIQGTQVFALVGQSGTGKSYKAQIVAQKYDIPLIIDDGLLIYDNKILAGHSAKNELNYLQAVRTALFDNLTHRQEMISALEVVPFKKILILGTSEKMVNRICEHLNLPEVHQFIHIEDISTPEEIAAALHSRAAGNHVVPVSVNQLKKDYGRILYDHIKIFLVKTGFFKKKSINVIDKTIVRPIFQQQPEMPVKQKIAKARTVLLTSSKEFDETLKISRIKITTDPDGLINVHCRLIDLSAAATDTIYAFRKFTLAKFQEANLPCKELHVSFGLKTPIKKKER